MTRSTSSARRARTGSVTSAMSASNVRRSAVHAGSCAGRAASVAARSSPRRSYLPRTRASLLPKYPEEAAPRHPCGGGDLLDRDRLVAVLGEQRLRVFEQLGLHSAAGALTQGFREGGGVSRQAA